MIRSLFLDLAPESVQQRMRAYRRSGTFRQAGVSMIHVPRTAGTSVTFTIFGRFIGHFGVADLLSACPDDVVALPRFTITRNPWDRLVSAWSFARQGCGTEFDEVSGTISGQKIRMRHGSRYQIPEFETMQSFVHEWLAKRDVHQLDGVFRPQTDFICTHAEESPFDHLGRIEHLDQTAIWLSELLSKQVTLPRLNLTNRPDYRDLYTEEMRKIVSDCYGRDIALLGYKF